MAPDRWLPDEFPSSVVWRGDPDLLAWPGVWRGTGAESQGHIASLMLDPGYAVIDDIVEDSVTVVVSQWPSEKDGRRLFSDDPDTDTVLALPLEFLQSWIDHYRSRDAELANSDLSPQRPLRIGDAFAISNTLHFLLMSAAATDPQERGTWEAWIQDPDGPSVDLIDVTRSARYAAKVASTSMLSSGGGDDSTPSRDADPDKPDPSGDDQYISLQINGVEVSRAPARDGDRYLVTFNWPDGSVRRTLAEGEI